MDHIKNFSYGKDFIMQSFAASVGGGKINMRGISFSSLRITHVHVKRQSCENYAVSIFYNDKEIASIPNTSGEHSVIPFDVRREFFNDFYFPLAVVGVRGQLIIEKE